MTEIYHKKEWLEIKQILQDRKQGKYPALDKKVKKEEKQDETRKNNHQ